MEPGGDALKAELIIEQATIESNYGRMGIELSMRQILTPSLRGSSIITLAKLRFDNPFGSMSQRDLDALQPSGAQMTPDEIRNMVSRIP